MCTGMNAYALDLRQQILRACAQSIGSQRTIAAGCGVSQSCMEKRRRRALCDESARARRRRLAQAAPDAT